MKVVAYGGDTCLGDLTLTSVRAVAPVGFDGTPEMYPERQRMCPEGSVRDVPGMNRAWRAEMLAQPLPT